MKAAIGATLAVNKLKKATDLPTIPWTKLDLQSLVGKGPTGSSVYRATYRNQTIAVRRIKHNAGLTGELIEMKREMQHLVTLRHPHLLKYFGLASDGYVHGILME